MPDDIFDDLIDEEPDVDLINDAARDDRLVREAEVKDIDARIEDAKVPMPVPAIDLDLPDPAMLGENARTFAQRLIEAAQQAAGPQQTFQHPMTPDEVADLVVALWDALDGLQEEKVLADGWTVDPFQDEATGRPFLSVDARMMAQVHEFRVDLQVVV